MTLLARSFATALLARGRDSAPLKGDAWPVVGSQLMAHQQVLTDRFVAQGWKPATHPRYTVPVPRACSGNTSTSSACNVPSACGIAAVPM